MNQNQPNIIGASTLTMSQNITPADRDPQHATRLVISRMALPRARPSPPTQIFLVI